ncbi:hypothetical protein CsSME_00005163 [Camellia sinensis var. sinensis]
MFRWHLLRLFFLRTSSSRFPRRQLRPFSSFRFHSKPTL